MCSGNGDHPRHGRVEPGHDGRGRFAPPLVAVVLPPRESFSPQSGGAIALIVWRLAGAGAAFDATVTGRPFTRPVPHVPYLPAPQAWRPAPLATRYAAGVARVLRKLRPALIEVHNRPDVAHALLPLGVPVALMLHNDPTTMRGFSRIGDLHAMLAVSRWVAERTGRADCQVLPNPIDLAAIPPPTPERARKILFAGRVVADKGADAFVAACALALPRLPGWTAEIIGADGFGARTRETPFLRRLRPLARAAGVAMPGWRPHADVLEAMARAAIVVVPSRWPEPFGMTALEAMACGAALAYAPRGGLPEVVGDAGLPMDPDDPAGMADALVSLAGNPARRAALETAGRARAQAFDVALIAARLDAIRAATLAAWPGRATHPI